MKRIDDAIPVLVRELADDGQWVRLSAAIVLDELDDEARPAIPPLKRALQDRQNKYVVRVANACEDLSLDEYPPGYDRP